MRFEPGDYRLAPSGEGPLKNEWRDKPHRLIYDLVGEVERLRSDNAALSDRIAADYQEKANLQAALLEPRDV